jgi:cytosine/adenosine deaminase-related metal-dependent hydrolase
MTHPAMQPDYEPLRSLIYSANDRAIRDVFVDGRQVVRGGELVHFRVEEHVEMLRRGQQEVIARAPERDWAGRTLDAMSPRVYPVRG